MHSLFDVAASSDYVALRSTFLTNVDSLRERGDLDVAHEAMLHPAQCGRHGEALFTDVVCVGAPDATRTLVLSSGVHGVEGYAGGALQTRVLQRLAAGALELGADVRLVFVFAVNPFAMSWLRRTDEKHVDLNRNFIDFEAPLPRNPAYRFFAPMLRRPPHLRRNPHGIAVMVAAMVALRASKGLGAGGFAEWMRTGISSGQYEDPGAPFFGGREPSPARLRLEQAMEPYLREPTRDCVWLDLHTGLGAPGEVVPILRPGERNDARAMRSRCEGLFGGAFVESLRGGDADLGHGKMLGHFVAELETRVPDATCLALTIELGTAAPRAVLMALAREAEEHRESLVHGPSMSQRAERSRQSRFETFFLRDRAWFESGISAQAALVERILADWNPRTS